MSTPRQVLAKMLRSAYPSWIGGNRPPEHRPAWQIWKPAARNMVLAAAFCLPAMACTPDTPSDPPRPIVSVPAPAASSGDPAAMAAALKRHGWSAPQAWLWYTEYSALASTQMVSPGAPLQVHQANAARTTMLEHLRRVRTPAQMDQYLQLWPERMSAMGAPADPADPVSDIFWQHLGVDAWVARSRMATPGCAISDFDQAVEDMPINWKQLDEQLALDAYHRRAFNLVRAPATINERDALAQLEKAFLDTGLRALRLPAGANDPSDHYNMAVALTAANMHLATRTGWEGGVLGLSGRVSLVFIDPSVQVDAVARRDAHGSVIGMASGSGWSPLAHEWFHALDFELARLDPRSDQVASVAGMSGKGFEAFERLRQALVDPLDPTARQLWRQELEEHIARRWPSAERQESMQSLRTAIANPRFNRERTFMGMVEDDMHRGAPEANARIAAETFMVEAQMLATSPPQDTSPWLFVLKQVEQAAAQSIDQDNPAATRPFTAPAEMAAYAFEASFPGPHVPIISSGLAGWKPLRTPSQVESVRHAQAFDQLFASLAPWWDMVREHQPSTPSPSPKKATSPTTRNCP